MVHREGVSIGPTALNEIIVASHQDLRQVGQYANNSHLDCLKRFLHPLIIHLRL